MGDISRIMLGSLAAGDNFISRIISVYSAISLCMHVLTLIPVQIFLAGCLGRPPVQEDSKLPVSCPFIYFLTSQRIMVDAALILLLFYEI